MLNYKDWLQVILDNSSVIANGEEHPASDIYTPDMLDSEDHDWAWFTYNQNVSASLYRAHPNGETWSIA